MSRKPVRRAALGLLFAILLGIAVPVPSFASDGESAASVFSTIWEWITGLWPEVPDPGAPTTCTENCGDAGYGADPNG